MQFRDLPPLHFLPAFEAAGRLGSFKAAARELHVTPSAVSQQLKSIEDDLGIALFERRTRSVRLTPAGAAFLEETQRALSLIAGASRRIRQRARERVLRLSMPDFMAYEFILPRLSSFRARFPGVELSLDASPRIVDFATCDIDAAIRIADGPWPGLVSYVLGDASIAAVCSQTMARELRHNSQLVGQTLIELRAQHSRGWKAVMKRLGEREPTDIVTFEGYMETLRAAEQGLGVTFGIFPLVTEWVTSGRLAVPLALRIPFVGKIFFVHRKADEKDPLHRDVLAWLRAEYAALPALPEGRLLRRSRTAKRAPRSKAAG